MAEEENMKKWYRSRMLWVNAIGFAAIILTAVFAREEIATQLLVAEGSILAVADFILRLATNQGLQK